MSRFFSGKHRSLTPYTPDDQPRDMEYINLDSNESPFPPPAEVSRAVADTASKLHLYPDSDLSALKCALAEKYGVGTDEIIVTSGSDEALNLAFMAFCDVSRSAAFPDITYESYPVFAKINGVPYEEVPLRDDFTVNISDYLGIGKTIFLANPNTPTGLSLHRSVIERVIASNPDNVVVVDEAYADFGAESCVPLIHKYDNLLVTRTFSNSRSMAGARLGFGIGCRELITDLETLRRSINHSIDRMTEAAGICSLRCDGEAEANCRAIIKTREYTKERLYDLGFEMTDSAANFVFVKHPKVGGAELYTLLKARGILVRHFDRERIRDYNRITIGSKDQMDALIDVMKEILSARI